MDPKLAPLSAYGGATQTYALMQGSPALDAGDNALAATFGLTTDQRGLGRVFGGAVDIGAYETQPPALMGDVNHDGAVNLADFLLLARNFGNASTPLYENGDLDGNGAVNLVDLLTLVRNFGHRAPAAPASTPTPTPPQAPAPAPGPLLRRTSRRVM